jgi:transglutaminase-like putative cysteine protease
MRANPQETSGSRVRLRYSVRLQYEVAGQSAFLLNVHAAKTPRQIVLDEQFVLTPPRPWSVNADAGTRNRIAAFNAPAGSLTVEYEALVDIEHRIVDPVEVIAEGPAALPMETLPFIRPSRYCQADLVQQDAWDRFGHLQRNYGQVRAVRDWVRDKVRFRVGTSTSTTSVLDTLRDGVGVCRDFAHTMIAYCRALNYPARIVTAVDYGADPALGPPDFHAYVEVFIGGSWYVFDPTGISPVTGLLRIGTGRDAADVSFATLFGPVRTGMPRIRYAPVDDPVLGIALPAATELAVSTAD